MKPKDKTARHRSFTANKKDALAKHRRIGFKSTETNAEHHCKVELQSLRQHGYTPGESPGIERQK